MITLTQGDSYEQDFDSQDVPLFDINWGGRWSVITKLGAPALYFGSLGVSDDKTTIMLRILPDVTTVIPVGKYLLIAQVENTVLGFRREVLRETLEIKQQGIV